MLPLGGRRIVGESPRPHRRVGRAGRDLDEPRARHTVYDGYVRYDFWASAGAGVGMAVVVVFAVGEFDLSISAILGLAATFLAVLVTADGWSHLAASLATIAASIAVGALNGFIVVVLGSTRSSPPWA